MRFEFMKIPRWCSSASIFTVLLLLAAGGAGASGGDYGYVGEIRLYATPFCPGSPHAEDVTGRPGVGNAPVPGMRYCKNLVGADLGADGRTAPDMYLAEIKRLEATQCPKYYWEADGRLLDLGRNQALFALIGTTFGGNDRDRSNPTFALPKLPPPTPAFRNCLAYMGVFPGGGRVARYIGEVLMLAHQSCPDGSIEADGREMNVQGYSALFYLLNTTYGEGRSYSGRSGSYPVTFRVPDLRRLAPPNIKYCLAIDGSFPMRPEHQ